MVRRGFHFFQTPLGALILISMVSLATLMGAWFFELVINLKPCKLCLQQRWPYYAVLGICAVWVSFVRLKPFSYLALMTLVIVFAISAALGIYHAGVEWRWWAGPSDCGMTGAATVTQVSDFLSQLNTVRVVSCEDAAWRFLGLSLAGWNAIISMGMVCYSILVLWVQRHVCSVSCHF
jgi:disulfide bond formation protein DsbB